MEEFASWVADEFEKNIPAFVQEFKTIEKEEGEKAKREKRRTSKTALARRQQEHLAKEVRNFLCSYGIQDTETALAILDRCFGEDNRLADVGFGENITSIWKDRFLNYTAEKGYEHSLFPCLNAAPPLPDTFPDFSWALIISFTLDKPFFSRTDGEFHVHDNAICRERILQLPMIKPSTWKGNMRSAAELIGIDTKEIVALFGNDHDEQAHFNRGRLFFFPTFFQKIGIEVITPLERRTRTPKKGRGALPVEVVPAGQSGKFYLLYLPPWMGSEKERLEKVRAEYEAIPEILKGALRTYGFSAKKADGWGCIKEPFPGSTVKIKKETLQEKPFKTFTELTDIFTQLRPPQEKE